MCSFQSSHQLHMKKSVKETKKSVIPGRFFYRTEEVWAGAARLRRRLPMGLPYNSCVAACGLVFCLLTAVAEKHLEKSTFKIRVHYYTSPCSFGQSFSKPTSTYCHNVAVGLRFFKNGHTSIIKLRVMSKKEQVVLTWAIVRGFLQLYIVYIYFHYIVCIKYEGKVARLLLHGYYF